MGHAGFPVVIRLAGAALFGGVEAPPSAGARSTYRTIKKGMSRYGRLALANTLIVTQSCYQFLSR